MGIGSLTSAFGLSPIMTSLKTGMTTTTIMVTDFTKSEVTSVMMETVTDISILYYTMTPTDIRLLSYSEMEEIKIRMTIGISITTLSAIMSTIS